MALKKYFSMMLVCNVASIVPIPTTRTTTISTQVLSSNSFGAVDLTLIPGAYGESVVDACIQKINTVPGMSQLRNDYGLLKRLALVESRFGEISREGGIWKIRQHIHSRLAVASSDLVNILDEYAQQFMGSNTWATAHHNYSVPLHSAMAARIFLESWSSSNQLLPQTINYQIAWWRWRYSPSGNVNHFLSTVQAYENLHQCNVSKLDIWFLIDGSGSVRDNDFLTCLNFVKETAAKFVISPNHVRTGLMIFGTNFHVTSKLDQHQSNAAFASVVSSATKLGGFSNYGGALRELISGNLIESNGGRPLEEGVPRMLVVLADGPSWNSVANEIKAIGVTIFAVAIGGSSVKTQIDGIASEPLSKHVFHFLLFSRISILPGRIHEGACRVSAYVPRNTSLLMQLQPLASQSSTYYRVSLPLNASVQLHYFVDNLDGDRTVYLSEEVARPNSALHNTKLQLGTGYTVTAYNSTLPESASANERVLYMSVYTSGLQHFTLGFNVTLLKNPKSIAILSQVESSCGQHVNITIPQGFLKEKSTDQIVISPQVSSNITALSSVCVYNAFERSFYFKLTECSPTVTKINDTLLFVWTIRNQPQWAPQHYSPIQRFGDQTTLTVSCQYKSENVLVQTFQATNTEMRKSLSVLLKQQGRFKLTLSLYTDQSHSTRINTGSSIMSSQYVFALVNWSTDDADKKSLYIQMHKCWATPTSNPDDPTYYTLIENNCPVQHSTDPADAILMTRNFNLEEAAFQFRAFFWTGRPDQATFVTCKISVCNSDIPNSTCNDMSCNGTSPERSRRSSHADDDILTFGPINVVTQFDRSSCFKDNGGCSDICSWKNKQVVCSCTGRKYLDYDGKTCKKLTSENGGSFGNLTSNQMSTFTLILLIVSFLFSVSAFLSCWNKKYCFNKN